MVDSTRRLELVRELIESFNRHDPRAIGACLATDVSVGRGDGKAWHGRERLVSHLEDFFRSFPDARLTSMDLFTPGENVVLSRWILDATHCGPFQLPEMESPVAPLERKVRIAGADLFFFNDAGEIERDEMRVATAELLAQIRGPFVSPPDPEALREFAERYTAAWCSQDPTLVTDCYSQNGSLTINGGVPAVGGAEITASAYAFMQAFSDLAVIMDDLLVDGNRAVYCWTLRGTNDGPGGTGKRVEISGYEIWKIGFDGLIAESHGFFDSSAYQYQIEHGV